MGNYQGQSSSWFNRIPPVVRHILIINVLIYFVMYYTGRTTFWYENFALFPVNSGYFKIYQLVTHMFMHGGFAHLFFNMYSLYFFGCVLENVWGRNKFLFYYFVTGIGAAICHLAVMYYTGESYPIPTVGASGAVYGVLLGYGMLFPKNRITMIFPIPMTIKSIWLVVIFGAIELLSGFFSNDNTAHWAHLGGMLFGLILINRWRRKDKMYTDF